MKKTAKLGCLVATAMVVASGAAFAQGKDMPKMPRPMFWIRAGTS